MELIQEGLLATINTLPPSPSIINFIDESITKLNQIKQIPTAKEPQIEGFNISYITKVNVNINIVS